MWDNHGCTFDDGASAKKRVPLQGGHGYAYLRRHGRLATASCDLLCEGGPIILVEAWHPDTVRVGRGTAEARCDSLSRALVAAARYYVAEARQAGLVVAWIYQDRVGEECRRIHCEICWQEGIRGCSSERSTYRGCWWLDEIELGDPALVARAMLGAKKVCDFGESL
jgi:hypothetical protein